MRNWKVPVHLCGVHSPWLVPIGLIVSIHYNFPFLTALLTSSCSIRTLGNGLPLNVPSAPMVAWGYIFFKKSVLYIADYYSLMSPLVWSNTHSLKLQLSLLKSCIYFPPHLVSWHGYHSETKHWFLWSVRRINWAIVMWQSFWQVQVYKDESLRSSSEKDRHIKRNMYYKTAKAWVLYFFTWKSLFPNP